MTDKLQQYEHQIPLELVEELLGELGCHLAKPRELFQQAYEAGYTEGETNGYEAGRIAGLHEQHEETPKTWTGT